MKTKHKKGSLDTHSHAQSVLRRKLETAIFDILEKRQTGKTCCPSEAAQKIDPNKWRDLMPLTRDVARKLRREGRLEICQHGTVLISDAWTGPIRLRLPFQTQKLVTCKPRQSAGATEALAASAGVLCQSPEVTVSENRGGAKRPRDSDGHGDRVTMSVNRSSSLVVKKRGGPRSQRTLMAKTDKLECVYKP